MNAIATEAEVKLYDCRDAFSQTLESMAAEDKRIVVVVNDSVSSTKLKGFRAKFPERFINVAQGWRTEARSPMCAGRRAF
jgi:transketolase